MSNTKRIAHRTIAALTVSGFQPEISYHYNGRRVSRARSCSRTRPRRLAKKIAKRGGYVHHVHNRADAIRISAGHEAVTISRHGVGYSARLFTGEPSWPSSACTAAGL